MMRAVIVKALRAGLDCELAGSSRRVANHCGNAKTVEFVQEIWSGDDEGRKVFRVVTGKGCVRRYVRHPDCVCGMF